MKKFVAIDAQGIPQYTLTPSNPADFEGGAVVGNLTMREIPFDQNDLEVVRSWYFKGGEWRIKPTKPTEFHVFDTKAEKWVPDLKAAVSSIKEEIKSSRIEKCFAPIEVDGALIDADVISRSNIELKLSEVQNRIALNQPLRIEELVWRGADNRMHTWPDQVAYMRWLQSCVVAISTRNTKLHEEVWRHKAALDKYESVEEILGHSLI